MTNLPYNPDAWNTPNVDVSPLSIKSELNFSAEVGVHTMLWWGNGSHLNVGYRSDDPKVIASQLAAMQQRGSDFVILNWYGTLSQPGQSATQAWVKACEASSFPFILSMCNGMFATYNMPKGMDVTTWGTQMMQYAHANFLTSPMYKKTKDGRFLMVNFNWPLVNGLDIATVLKPYTDVAMLFEHASGVSKPGSSGAFGWLGVTGKYDPQSVIETYAADFLASMQKSVAANPAVIAMPSLPWGFDDHDRTPKGDPTKSVWDATKPARWADSKNGQTWLNVLSILNGSKFKPPYIQLVTWNDYEEDTALERGINSGVAVSLDAAQGVLAVTLSGNLATVDHVDIYVNGSILSTQKPAAALTFDLNSLNLAPGPSQFTCQAVAVGRSFFQNQASSAVTTKATVIPGVTTQLNIPSVPVQVAQQNVDVPTGLPPNLSVPVSASVGGLTVSGSLDVAAPQTVSIPVPSQTVNIPLTQPVTVIINAQTTWS